MINKYRVHEVAKDFGIASKEVIDLLGSHFESPKKHMTALENDELDVVFEHYTQKTQSDNFDDYFNESKRIKEERAAQLKAEQAAKAPAAKPQPAPPSPAEAASKQPAPRPEAPAAQSEEQSRSQESPKAPPVQESRESAPGQAQPQAERPHQPQQQGGGYQGSRPQQQGGGYQGSRPPQQGGGYQGNRPQQQGGGYQGNRPQQQGGGYQGNRPQQQGGGYQGNRPQQQGGGYQGNRPQQQGGGYQGNRPQQQGGGYQGNRPQQQGGGHQGNRPATAARPARPARTAPAQGAATDPGGVRRVDMRAAQVELDKYDPRYEQIAPGNLAKKDTGVKKQKLNQRSAQRGRPFMSRKEQEAEKMRRIELEKQRRQKLEIVIPDQISVGELALRLKVQASEVVKRLMMSGVMAAISDVIDYDTAALVAMEIGAKVEREVVVTIEDRLFIEDDTDPQSLSERSPVVVVMGHVDHGKTSLLDAIRKTDVISTEAGGITQHIGAYQVTANGRPITFLDTPGHEAFTAMRARGAQVTDIAILVVAADDGIMPQTVEAINHAKAAGVAIIVAINKIDKPAANPEKVKQELTEYGLVPEEWGGETICVPVSAKAHTNIDTLLEMVLLTADVLELKANPDAMARGTVIEAKLDKGRGPVATLLVQNGTMRTGDILIAGAALGRVRVMLNDKGERVDAAGPSTPVEVTGLSETPDAGDLFNVVEDERLARELVEKRKHDAKEEMFGSYTKVTLDNLFSQIAQGEVLELPIIIKADVQGSVEAVRQSLEKLSTDEVRVRIIHGGVGGISESDVMLASASGATIIGFNVRPGEAAMANAENDGVELRLYRIIYDAIEDVKNAMKGMLPAKIREKELGRVEVRNVYKITNVGVVAGCYVLSGKITRSANIRVVRDGIIVADDKLDSLKRFKDDVKEVASGFECGIALTRFNDIKNGDIFEAYELEEYRD